MLALGQVHSGTVGFCAPLNIVATTGPALGRRNDTTQQESEDRPGHQPSLSSRFQETRSIHCPGIVSVLRNAARINGFILVAVRIDYKQNFGSRRVADRLPAITPD
jgi:hypothetical protein